MKKILFIINEQFPYSKGEPFLETEVKFFEGFDKIIVFPTNVKNTDVKRDLENIDDRIIIIHSTNTSFIFKLRIVKSLFNLFLEPQFYKELRYLVNNRKLSFHTLRHLIAFMTKGISSFSYAKKWVKSNLTHRDEITFYSYWLYYEAYTAIKLNNYFLNNGITISRCHGFDLYASRHSKSYLPLRNYIYRNVNYIFPISYNGKDYLQNEIEEKFPTEINVHYLGTLNFGIQQQKDNFNHRIKIVSCSRLVSLKRVELIIDTLSLISGVEIEWTHFGGGEKYKVLSEYANEKLKLKQNITYLITGEISNKEILDQYRKNYYDIFVSVSETEGLPVSIMEAISFGIPVIATDVGGTNEIVQNNVNGWLINKDFDVKDLANIIIDFNSMSNEEKMHYRKQARNIWMNKFNAEHNYKKFFVQLLSLQKLKYENMKEIMKNE